MFKAEVGSRECIDCAVEWRIIPLIAIVALKPNARDYLKSSKQPSKSIPLATVWNPFSSPLLDDATDGNSRVVVLILEENGRLLIGTAGVEL